MDMPSPQLPLPQPGSPAAPLPLEYASQPAGPYTLYSPQAVGLAIFLGTPIAGTIIIAMNYRHLGRPSTANKAIICGILATAALMGVGFILPSGVSETVIAVGVIVIMMKIAEMLQGEVFNRHKLAGGRVASLWKAAGIGLLSIIAIFVIIFALVFAGAIVTSPSTGKRLAVGSSEILYSGSATQADAQALGKALTDDGYFGGSKATTVLLIKNTSGATIEFVVNEAAGQKDGTIDIFTKITEDIASSVGGKPITLKLVTPNLKELKSKKVE